MTKSHPFQRSCRAHQIGLTLVELMVSLVISVVIALAAATAYLGTRSTATALASISNLNENGNLALDMIGRDIQMAGFYPAILSTGNTIGQYTNIKGTPAGYVAGTPTAYAQGVYGCDGARFNPVTLLCGATTANAPDSIVLNYFAAPELNPAQFSSGFDCLRQDVTLDPVNVGRAPALPEIISNRYGLSAFQSYVVQVTGGDKTVSSRSLGCNGNGQATASTTYQPIYEGFVDMVISYGANDGAGNLSPTRYRTAAEISAMPTVNDVDGWRRVTSVRVCLLTRTVDNIRIEDQTGELRTYTDCRGNTPTYAATDRTIFKRFERVFAVRNNLSGVH